MRTPAQYNPDGTVTLWDERGDDRDYFMRGGICWPLMVQTDRGADYTGFALVAAVDAVTGRIRILAQRKWVSVEHVRGEDGSIEYRGLGYWLNRQWARVFCRDFYWHQDDEMTKRYRLEILRSPVVEPKPQLIRVPWANDEDAKSLVAKYVKLSKFDVPKDSPLAVELLSAGEDPDLVLPAVWALTCLLAGVERYPGRKRRVA